MKIGFFKDIGDFVSRRSRYGFSEFIKNGFYFLVSLIIGWPLVIPLSKLIPRKRNRIVFIGRDKGLFADNVKYLFNKLYSLNTTHNLELFIVTDIKHHYTELSQKGLPALFYPTPFSVYVLLTSRFLIVDHDHWIFKFKFFLLYHACKIQLWHGVGMKYIGILKIKKEMRTQLMRILQETVYKIIGLIPAYDYVISTSEFYTKNVFSPSFTAKHIVEAGYPRNDIFFYKEDYNSDHPIFISVDNESYKKIKDLKQKGYKIILYTPTFRDSGGDPITDGAMDIERLNNFAEKHRLIFVFKFHPDPFFNYSKKETRHILWYSHSKDIYPVMPLSDLMITDYSAIFTDYLLLEKPIIFFPYDYSKYIIQDRAIQFDYQWITPGRKCYTYDDLEGEIENILIKGIDLYKNKRREILNIAFKYKDGKSSERIWQIIKKEMKNQTTS